MKHDLTNDEVLAALNAELERQGLTYRATQPTGRAVETDRAVLDAVDSIVKERGRPARPVDIHALVPPDIRRATVYSACQRLERAGVLVGSASLGYLRRTA